MTHCRRTGFHVVTLAACGLWPASLSAQVPYQPLGQLTVVNANATAAAGVSVHELENGASLPDIVLKDEGTTLTQREATISLIGLVKNPGVYLLRRTAPTTVLGGLALAGGITNRGSRSRVEVVRLVNGERKNVKVALDDVLQPGDTVLVIERFF